MPDRVPNPDFICLGFFVLVIVIFIILLVKKLGSNLDGCIGMILFAIISIFTVIFFTS